MSTTGKKRFLLKDLAMLKQNGPYALVLLFAFFGWFAWDIARNIEAALVGFFVLFLILKPVQRLRDPLLALFALWVLYMLAISYLAWQEYGDALPSQGKTIRFYAKIFLFIVFAWAITQSVKRVLGVLALALLGVTSAALWHAEHNTLGHIVSGQRVDFGLKNAQHTGVLFGLCLLGVLALAGRFRSWWKIPWAMVVLFLIVGVIAVQTRAVWLALTVCAAVWIALLLVALYRRGAWKRALGSGAILLAVSVTVWFLFAQDIVMKRLSKEREIIERVVRLDIDHTLPVTSIGNRLHTTLFALEKISERPLIGWGPTTYRIELNKSDLPKAAKRFGHLHNSYLEIAFKFGLIGFCVYVGGLLFLIWRVWAGWHQGRIADDLAVFFGLALLFYGIVNLFESYINYHTNFFFMAVIGGSIYALSPLQSTQPSIQGTQ